VTAVLLFLNMSAGDVTDLPRSVLQGENRGYKRMGLSTLLVFIGGGFTWLALYLGMGIMGVAAATLVGTLVAGLLFAVVARSYTPWFGVARPSPEITRQFMGLSGWFVGWNLIMKLMTASDVVVLGLVNSVESVTAYTLTKYAPETVVTIIAMVVFGIIPGLGRSIGSGDRGRASQVRGEIGALTWLALCSMGAATLVWNREFLDLWVGPGHYAGRLASLLIVIVVGQFVLIRNDAAIIDLTLDLRHKVIMGGVSVALALIASTVLVGYFNLGVVGLCLGIIAGRLVLTIGYPMLVGRFLGLRLWSQLKAAVRPGIVMALLFAGSLELDRLTASVRLSGLKGWLTLAMGAALTAVAAFVLAFGVGLSGSQRRQVIRRLRGAIRTEPSRKERDSV
jgi:O-antigen/teichoic acid export membrane protein